METLSQSVDVNEKFNLRRSILFMNTLRTLQLADFSGQCQLRITQSIHFSPIDFKTQDLSHLTSQDIVANGFPSLFIAQHAGGGKAEQIFLRGFDIDPRYRPYSGSPMGLPRHIWYHLHKAKGTLTYIFVIPEMINYVNFVKGPLLC
jgi:hypothetical protein